MDFSGAAQAGGNIWIATCRPSRGGLTLIELRSLATLAGTSERADSLRHLVRLVRRSRHALWAIDFPFGLPIEMLDDPASWSAQLELVCAAQGSAPDFGRWCVARTRQRCDGRLHVRRLADVEQRTPFDCYHYRIIYQTFYGMRDVLAPLARDPNITILPFQYQKLRSTRGVVIEACPASTLKRLGLPHQNYKQPAGGALTTLRRRVRRGILHSIIQHIRISDAHRRAIMRNPGADALDAVLAAVGAHQAMRSVDHAAISAHSRYPVEGFVYA